MVGDLVEVALCLKASNVHYGQITVGLVRYSLSAHEVTKTDEERAPAIKTFIFLIKKVHKSKQIINAGLYSWNRGIKFRGFDG
jgi:hypothetical protein